MLFFLKRNAKSVVVEQTDILIQSKSFDSFCDIKFHPSEVDISGYPWSNGYMRKLIRDYLLELGFESFCLPRFKGRFPIKCYKKTYKSRSIEFVKPTLFQDNKDEIDCANYYLNQSSPKFSTLISKDEVKNIKVTQGLTSTLLRGDCLDLMKGIPSNSIDCIISDLPYGSTDCAWDTILPMEQMWIEIKRIVKAKTPIILTSVQPFTSLLVSSNLKEYKHEWIYQKNFASNFRNLKFQPLKNHENVLVFCKTSPHYYPLKEVRNDNYKVKTGKRIRNVKVSKDDSYIKHRKLSFESNIEELKYPSSIQKFKRDRSGLHPTKKPVELYEYFIKSFSKENDVVLDITAGVGTAAEACIKTNRSFICIEKDEKYFEIMRKRTENLMKLKFG